MNNVPTCPVHQIPAVWREGVSKAGKNYAFFFCPITKAQNGGEYCSHKFDPPAAGRAGAAQRFDQSMAVDEQRSHAAEKDKTITRLALAKSFIEAGKPYNMDTVAEWHRWLALVEGRAQAVSSEIPTSEIHF